MTVVVYAKRSSTPSAEPQYQPGISQPVFVGDASQKWYQDAQTAGANTTYQNATTYALGNCVANCQSSYTFVWTNIAIDALDNTKISTASRVFSAADLDSTLYVTAGTGFTAPQLLWVIGVDTTASPTTATMSLTRRGAPVAVGIAASSSGTGRYRYKDAATGGGYYEAIAPITTGISGTGAGPNGHGLTQSDGGVTWKWIGDCSTTTHIIPQPSPLVVSTSVDIDQCLIVTGKDGVGKAIRNHGINTVFGVSDLHIDALDTSLMTTSQLPAKFSNQFGWSITVTGGTGFTLQRVYCTILSGFPSFTQCQLKCYTDSGRTIVANLGTLNSSGGTGTTGLSQQLGEFGVFHITPPASTKTVYVRIQVRLTGDVSYFQPIGWSTKFMRLIQVGSGQAPQGSTHDATPCAAPPPFSGSIIKSFFQYYPHGYTDGGYTLAMTNLAIDASDNTLVSSAGNALIPGSSLVITGGTGFTPQTVTLSPASSVVGAGVAMRASAPLGMVGSTGGIGRMNPPGGGTTGAYPDALDQATQPFGPYPLDADGSTPALMSLTPSWHRFTYVYRPHSAPGVYDGIWQQWVDGKLLIDVQQSAVGVTPTLGTKQWCSQTMVANHPTQQPLDTYTCCLGGVLTVPASMTQTFDFDGNIGDGDPANLDTWAIWTD